MVWSRLPPSGNAAATIDLLFARKDGFAARFARRNGFAEERTLFTGSGTGALYLALLGLKGLHPDRREVILPAWCCPSVPQAVLQAGLTPVLADLDPETFCYRDEELRALAGDATLTILIVHFFGIRPARPHLPNPPPFLLRDCAQDFHFRDAGENDCGVFYSFGRGKSLNGGHGGALCLPEGPWLSACRDLLEKFPPAGHPVPKALVINALSHPMAFGLLTRLPFLSIGGTVWEENMVFTRMHPEFPRLAAPLLDALERHMHGYAGLVREYLRLPAMTRGTARVPATDYGENNVPIRFPILIADAARRERVRAGLNGMFGGVTGQYPEILGRLPGAPASISGGAGRYPGCETIAREILTLPVTAWLLRGRAAFLDEARRLLATEHG